MVYGLGFEESLVREGTAKILTRNNRVALNV
jgi:hypothetical protein